MIARTSLAIAFIAIASPFCFSQPPPAPNDQPQIDAKRPALTDSDMKTIQEMSICAFVSTVAFVIAGIAFNLIPTFVAVLRGHPNSGAILVLSLFLGWTCIGWIVALVWAFTATAQPVIVVNNRPR